MMRTFDILAGESSGENVAEAVEEVAESNSLDLAAIIARFNDIDARINKIEETLNTYSHMFKYCPRLCYFWYRQLRR